MIEIFISQDPDIFGIILNYLRTKDIDLKQCDIRLLRHEAEYYNIQPLLKRLLLCEEMEDSGCGDLLFYCLLPAPNIPITDFACNPISITNQAIEKPTSSTIEPEPSTSSSAKPGSMIRVPEHPALHMLASGSSSRTNSNESSASATTQAPRQHSRNSSWDLRVSYNGNGRGNWAPGHSRTTSLDMRHSRNSSADLNKFIKTDLNAVFGQMQQQSLIDPLRVQIIKAHHNWISVAYAHYVICYR